MAEPATAHDPSALTVTERYQLANLEDVIAMGWHDLARGYADLMSVNVAEGSTTAAARARLEAIEIRLAEMESIERKFGTGSLLNLDHPTIVDFLPRKTMDGSPFIPASEIEAARRYRTRNEAAA